MNKKVKMKRIVLLLIAVVIVAIVGFYVAVELSPTNKVNQYTPQPSLPIVLINDASGRLINSPRQSHFGSSINLEEPTYLPPDYKVQQIRDDASRNSVNMYLSMFKITDKSTDIDFNYKEGGINVYVTRLPDNFNQTELVKMKESSDFPHRVINNRDFFFLNSTVENYQGEKWDVPTFVEMYDKQVMIEAYGFISPDELIKIIRSIKYDQPTTQP